MTDRAASAAIAIGVALAVAALPSYAATPSGPVGARAGLQDQFWNPLAITRPAPTPFVLSRSVPPPIPLAPAPVADPAPVAVVGPQRLRIPALAVDTAVTAIGVDDTGGLAIPGDGSLIGWWAGGPSLDSPTGTTVLVGHFDTREGPGALSRLSRGRPGQQVEVSVAGSIRTYAIERAESVRREDLAASGAFDQAVPGRLAIVTCTGPYDADRGGYRDNLVVYAIRVEPGTGTALIEAKPEIWLEDIGE